MSEMLPLFPLGAVLYPGMLLPLHIFEERYRQLVHELLDGPEPRRFGVIAIQKGRETGVGGISSLYEVGCTATLRETEEHDDGRFAEAGRAASLVAASFRDYLAALSERGLAQVSVPDLPEDPVLLSYLV